METKTSFIASAQGEWAIPDNTPEGVIVPLQIATKVVVESLKVHVSIEHPFIGDLKVNLIAPSGNSATLHNRVGHSNDNINQTFEGDILDVFKGEDINGEWQLQAIDFATRDNGFVKSWSLEAECAVVLANIEMPTELLDSEADVVSETIATDIDAAAEGINVEAATETVETTMVVETMATNVDAAAEGINVEAMAETTESIENEVTPDNLKEIEGIGPKIEELLNNEGIFTFAQLAATDTDTLQDILDEAGSAYNRHNPETWVEQAQLAAEGKWDELRTWQAELDGGRVVEKEEEE